MKASEAREIADERHYLRQIRRVAEQGNFTTTLEFVSRTDAEKTRIHLVELEYDCGKIKMHDDADGTGYTMRVSW